MPGATGESGCFRYINGWHAELEFIAFLPSTSVSYHTIAYFNHGWSHQPLSLCQSLSWAVLNSQLTVLPSVTSTTLSEATCRSTCGPRVLTSTQTTTRATSTNIMIMERPLQYSTHYSVGSKCGRGSIATSTEGVVQMSSHQRNLTLFRRRRYLLRLLSATGRESRF